MDTAGAWVIDRSRQSLAARGVEARFVGARPEHAILLREAHFRPTEAPPHREMLTLTSLVADIGESVYTAGADLIGGLGFLGRMVSVGAIVAVRPPALALDVDGVSISRRSGCAALRSSC